MDGRRRTMEVLLLLIFGLLASALDVPLDLPQPPTLTHQSPKDYIVDPRENIIIHCEAKGKPHPSFSWTRNGTQLDIEMDANVSMRPRSGTLVIDISREKTELYEGVYQCTAGNKHGTAVSNNIVVRQSRSPLWSKEKIQPIVVQEGVSLMLPCRPPAGLPPPIIFWMDNNFQRLPQSQRVSQSLNGDLYFSNVQRRDSRSDYICYARFPHTQTIQQKQPYTVTVLDLDALNDTMADFYNDTDLFSEAPSEERRPSFLLPFNSSSSVQVLRGRVLEIECIAEGLPTPDVYWSKQSGEFPAGRTFFLHYNKTLRIMNTSQSDDGIYRCTARNKMGSVHSSTTVTVHAAPYWLSGAPRNLVLAPGENGVLTCRATGIPKPSVTWSVNGFPINDLPRDVSRKVEEDTIIFTAVQRGSSAVYQCNVSNQHGYLLANAFVSVLSEPPRVLTPAHKVYQVMKNQRALIDCFSFGSPVPKITWFKDSRSSVLEGDPYVLHANGTLEIPVSQIRNSGKYTCAARNALGIYENHVYLEVKEPTRILEQPEYRVVLRGRTVVFECKVKHDSSLTTTMTWLKDDEELPEDHRFLLYEDSLTIMEVTDSDAGVYTCIVNTTLDQDSARAELTVVEATPPPAVVYERPDSPTDLELTDHRKRSVQLTWTPGNENNSPIQKFLVQYEDSLHHPGHWTNLTEVPGTRTTVHLKLSPYVHYSFRVLAVNAVGLSRASLPSRTYRTDPAAPDQNPSEVEGFGTKHNNLVISWKPLTALQSNGPGLHYRVMWRQKTAVSEWTTVTVANHSKFTVSETPTFVPYEIKVQAVNDIGPGPEPAIAHAHSGEDLPVSAPQSVRVDVVNSSVVEIHWDAVSAPLIRGHLKGYKVYYWRKHSVHRNQPDILLFSGSSPRGVLVGLQPFSLYATNVRATNGRGDGPASDTLTFKTPEGVPGAPVSLVVSNPDLDSLMLEWRPPTEHNGHITGYTLRYQPVVNSSSVGMKEEELTLPANETSVTLLHLKSSTRYRFSLQAQTGAGLGPIAFQEGVTTLEEGKSQSSLPVAWPPPGRPTEARPTSAFGNISSSVGEDGAVISWEYWGPAESLFLEYKESHSGEQHWFRQQVNSSHSARLTGLKAGLSYRVRLSHGAPPHSPELLVSLPAMVSRQVDVATQGWFIGLMCAIALLILILLIVCFIQRNKGGKYPVKEKEDAHTDPAFQPMKDEDCMFGEYSDTEDQKASLGSRSPSNGTGRRRDSDDSLVEYGDGGDGDGQFNEDGSFIGQYSGRDAQPPLSTAVNSIV